jgi:hypothetical protein
MIRRVVVSISPSFRGPRELLLRLESCQRAKFSASNYVQQPQHDD